MRSSNFRAKFEEEYRHFLLSELVLALMEEDQISVRKLARDVGISPTVIQDIRSGARSNITLKNFLHIIRALGGEVRVKKGKEEFPLLAA